MLCPSMSLKKRSLDLAQTILHSCLKSAGWPAVPKALSLGAPEPASRAHTQISQSRGMLTAGACQPEQNGWNGSQEIV